MWRSSLYVSVMVGLLASSQWLFASSATIGKARVPDCPQMEKLANRDNRVYGHRCNFQTWFYFSGNTKALNQFLQDYAALKDRGRLLLIIHPEPAAQMTGRPVKLKIPVDVDVNSPEGRSLMQKQSFRFSYDWRMDWVYAVRSQSEVPARIVDKVEVWLGGNVNLDELRVPTEIEVKSGGEVEEFIAEHEARRKEAACKQ